MEDMADDLPVQQGLPDELPAKECPDDVPAQDKVPGVVLVKEEDYRLLHSLSGIAQASFFIRRCFARLIHLSNEKIQP